MSEVEWRFQQCLSDCGIAANYEGDGQYGGSARRLRKFFDAGVDAGWDLAQDDATPQPADNWIKCSERLPNEADADFEYRLWCWFWERGDMKLLLLDQVIQSAMSGIQVSFQSTGLTRPNPPAEGAE